MSILRREKSIYPARISINVPEIVHREIKLIAQHSDMTITELVINALSHYVELKNIRCNARCCLPYAQKNNNK